MYQPAYGDFIAILPEPFYFYPIMSKMSKNAIQNKNEKFSKLSYHTLLKLAHDTQDKHSHIRIKKKKIIARPSYSLNVICS